MSDNTFQVYNLLTGDMVPYRWTCRNAYQDLRDTLMMGFFILGIGATTNCSYKDVQDKAV